MILRPVEAGEVPRAARWLAEPDNTRWLDFGAGLQVLLEPALRVMTQRPTHCLRLFAPEPGGEPLGLVALSNISPAFGSGTLWYVLGEKRHAGRGCTTAAVGRLLDLAFAELGLHSVNAWVVETNLPSRRVLEKNGFRQVGRQRQCHALDGELHDRLLYDLLAAEHERR